MRRKQVHTKYLCPYCKMEIDEAATKCPYCTADISSPEVVKTES